MTYRPRKIIICFDGTGNEIGKNETNILRLYQGLRDDETQLKHYVPGIGTLEGPRLVNSKLARNFRSLIGLAFGLGLENDVLDAYSFLCRHYRDGKDQAFPERDQIYIFGFSRGAYAARILAGFLFNVGLLDPERLHLVAEVFRAYRAVTETERMGQDDDITFAQLRAYDSVLDPNRSIPVRMLGLFDTVSSMVRLRKPLATVARTGSIIELGTHANIAENPSVRIVLQALAVDEKRSMFRPLLWQHSDYYPNRFRHGNHKRKQYVEQRWFPGYHSDVGGSAGGDNDVKIGKRSLSWMLTAMAQAEHDADREDAQAHGLTSIPEKRLLRLKPSLKKMATVAAPSDSSGNWHDPYAMAPIHPSMSLGWMPLEYLIPKTRLRREWPHQNAGPRWYLPSQEPRRVPNGHIIDESVYERMEGHPTYCPENIPKTR